MSLKKRNKRSQDNNNVIELSEDEAFDAVLALNSASSSQETSNSGFTTTASSSQASSSSGIRRRRSVGSLEDDSKKKTNAAERQAKKQKKEEHKAAKAAALEKNKIYKPGECMKYMKIEMHPTLSAAWYMADVSREASQAGCRISAATDLFHPALLMWTRLLQPTITVSDVQCGLKTKERCDRALYISPAEDVAEKVANRKLSQHVAMIRDMSACKLTLVVFGAKDYFNNSSQEKVANRELSQHVAMISDMSACKLTLVVFGAKDYFKSSGRKTNNSSKKLMTDIDLEMAIADLLVTADCDTVLVDTPNELALLIVQFTKAIAEAPHKQAKRALDEQAEFYMRGDNKKCVRVDSDGNGVKSLWQQMIAILPHSSLETSRAVCAQYKSPLELYEALQLPDSVSTLADLPVSRSGVAGSRARRLGPEFAKKMRTLFTADDGNILIE